MEDKTHPRFHLRETFTGNDYSMVVFPVRKNSSNYALHSFLSEDVDKVMNRRKHHWVSLDFEPVMADGEEYGLLSRIESPIGNLHIPMVDFVGKVNAKHELGVITGQLKCSPIIFDSGNSKHAYYPTLLRSEDWIKYMGALNLIECVDKKWIGCSLIMGESTLRWSAKDPMTRALGKIIPKYVEENRIDFSCATKSSY